MGELTSERTTDKLREGDNESCPLFSLNSIQITDHENLRFFLLTFVLLISCSEISESSSKKTKVEVPENKVEENSQEKVVQMEEIVEPLKTV